MKPKLTLEHGCLRPSRATDLDKLQTLLHDKEVRRYLCDDTTLPRSTIAAMLAESDKLDEKQLGLWVIETDVTDFAGIIGLTPVSEPLQDMATMKGGIEPVIALHPSVSSRGLATIALLAVINHARTTLRLPYLVAAVDAPNQRSHQLLARCGFKAFDRKRGPTHDLTLYWLCLSSPDREPPKENRS